MNRSRCRSVGPIGGALEPGDRLKLLAAEAFAELQRCDTKAAALCATGLAGFAAVAAVLVVRPPVSIAVGLWAAALLQAGSVALSVAVLRPALRAAGPHQDSFLDVAGTAPEELLAAVRLFSPDQMMRADSHRAVELSALARRKFTLLRHAATLLILGIVVAGVVGLVAATQVCFGLFPA